MMFRTSTEAVKSAILRILKMANKRHRQLINTDVASIFSQKKIVLNLPK